MEKTVKTAKDLKIFYEATLRNDLENLETERKTLTGKVIMYYGITGLAVLILFIVLTSSHDPQSGPIILGTIIITVISCSCWYYYLCRNYKSRFKDVVLAVLVKRFSL